MKKGICILAILAALLPFGMLARAGDLPPIPLTTKKTRIAGDANDDRTVDLRDATVIARHLAGGWGVSINTDNADVNGDKTVDLKDAVLLRRYLAGGWSVELK